MPPVTQPCCPHHEFIDREVGRVSEALRLHCNGGSTHVSRAEFAALGEDVAAVVAETRDISKTVGEMKTEARLRRSELSFRSTLLVAVIAAAASVASAWLAAHGVK